MTKYFREREVIKAVTFSLRTLVKLDNSFISDLFVQHFIYMYSIPLFLMFMANPCVISLFHDLRQHFG